MFTGKFSPRRLFRLHWNRKHKQRDRYKHDEPKKIFDANRKYNRFHLWARPNTRVPAPPETGHGVAYEYRQKDEDLFGHP